jgi:methionyl-tRNA formyltransferase
MTGVTTFMIDKKIDTGGIILREEYRMRKDETAGEVHDALMGIGSDLVVTTARGIIEGTVETRVQQSFIQGDEVLKAAPKLTKELCHIDWNDSTRHIYNLVRGLSPYPTAFTEITRDDSPATQLKIFSASQMEYDGPEAPGAVLSDGKSWIAIRTLDGALKLESVQLAGKKRMEARAFLAGFREPASWRCTQGTSRAEIERVRNLSNS